MMARPIKLTPELAYWIVARTRDGWPRFDVIRAGGFGRRTLDRWLALGRDGHPHYESFALAYDQAHRQEMNRRAAERRQKGRIRLGEMIRQRTHARRIARLSYEDRHGRGRFRRNGG